MRTSSPSRRDFMKVAGLGAVASAAASVRAAAPDATRLAVNPTPRFDLSPHLYMQFMEPLGTTDGSVSAAWDYNRDCWREDVVEVTADLAPPMIRWGGILMAYYRWREAVGPRDTRVPMRNIVWGGMEPNQVGTHEFIDFCRRVQADPLICVNFESDGRKRWQKTPKGEVRMGDAQEAADWVRYCNDPDSAERRGHGVADPYKVTFWQLGNETSYEKEAFHVDVAAQKSIEFAKAMRAVDPDIKLIGWGDVGWPENNHSGTCWGPRMLEIAGEHLDYLAFHHMFNHDHGLDDSPLCDTAYRDDPAWTWERLMEAPKAHESRINWIRDNTKDYDTPLAMTECHFAFPGRNRCEVLSTWAAGVAYARLANLHERHGDRLKIATLADFCGTRWQVNAVMIPVPGGRSFLMPAALVMRLYRHHSGEQALDVSRAPGDLDVTASRTGDRVFLHVANTNRKLPVRVSFDVEGLNVRGGRVFELSADPEHEVTEMAAHLLQPLEKKLPDDRTWLFPAASVSAVELVVTESEGSS